MPIKEWLLPREERFYDALERLALGAQAGASEFVGLLEAGDPSPFLARLHKQEREGDALVHELYAALDSTFITPIDREDVASLAKALNSVLDATHRAASHLVAYGVRTAEPELVALAQILEHQARDLAMAVKSLRAPADHAVSREMVVNVHRLEAEADEVAKDALARLFDQADWRHVMKMREAILTIEAATDRCEDAADVVRSILVKHA